jgi:type IV secretory pathway TraG/TraD family ATPase VirD4
MPMLWRKKPPLRPALMDMGNGDLLTTHEACEGVGVLGESGAGKTSGPGNQLLRGFLQQGAGMLVLTAKPDECMRVARITKEQGRIGQFMRIGGGSPHRINLLDYCLNGMKMQPRDVAQMLATLTEVTSRETGGANEEFWKTSSERLFFHALNLSHMATGTCSFNDLYRVFTSMANSPAEVKSEEWRETSFVAQLLRQIAEKQGDEITADAGLAAEYITREMPSLSDRTRSSFVTMCMNVAEKFMGGVVGELFNGGATTINPEHIMGGAICVVDVPTSLFHGTGRLVQTLMKLMVQKAVLAREVNPYTRIVVCLQDESPQFLTSFDVEVQMLARQALLVNVHLAQSISAMQHSLGGGPKAEQMVHALMGNLQTKIFCRQSDVVTNEYAANLVGKRRKLFMNGSMAGGEYNPFTNRFQPTHPGGFSSGFSENLDYEFAPHEFMMLASGGPKHGNIVEAVCFRGGQRFSTGKVWKRISFLQG